MKQVLLRIADTSVLARSQPKSPHAHTARGALRFVLCILVVAATFTATGRSMYADPQTGGGQNSPNKTQGGSQGTIAGSRREKLANPLNDLLQEAQRDIE